jgi:aspartyl-tRNA(Asn)/glutamyl-tRNA(Gln) amidotransferase subunit A
MKENIFIHQETGKDSSGKDGVLKGLRIAIQPNLSVKDWLTEAGSRALENYKALEDAIAVKRLKEKGAAIVGSIRMSELGFGLVGDASPYAFDQDELDAAVVTDTMGEARYAAALSGKIGYKPSYGICSRLGLIGLVPSMEAIGVITSSPDLVAKIMGSISGADKEDFSMLTEGFSDFSNIKALDVEDLKIGVIKEVFNLLEPKEAEAFRGALGAIEKKGLTIKEISMPEFPLFKTVHQVVGSVEASSAAGKYDSVRYGHRAPGTENWNDMYIKSRAESFGTLVKMYLFQGAYFQFKNYKSFDDACRIRRRLVNQINLLFETVDFIVLPTRRLGLNAMEAKSVSDVYNAFALTCGANVCGIPAISLPDFASCKKEDLGLQIWGPHLKDNNLLCIASSIINSAKGEK